MEPENERVKFFIDELPSDLNLRILRKQEYSRRISKVGRDIAQLAPCLLSRNTFLSIPFNKYERANVFWYSRRISKVGRDIAQLAPCLLSRNTFLSIPFNKYERTNVFWSQQNKKTKLPLSQAVHLNQLWITTEVYLETYKTSMMDLFCNNLKSSIIGV